ncbi:hypothetical protein [Paenibacillus sp. YN15]|uniref:hypothetical protein n=1 Tax=Paenibacillus sp. YN15 TaxID=1742774 RepID=UPI0011BDAD1A|nr:hypothetical protein [Paenibacillus sp. YN15]
MTIENKWPQASPDFYRIASQENVVSIKGNCDLEVEFYDYANKFNKSAHILTNHILEKSQIRE